MHTTVIELLTDSEADGAVYEAARFLVDNYALTPKLEATAERELRRNGWVGDLGNGLCHDSGHTHLSLEEAIYVDAYEGEYIARSILPAMGVERGDKFSFVCGNPQEGEGVLHHGDREFPTNVEDVQYWLSEGGVERALIRGIST